MVLTLQVTGENLDGFYLTGYRKNLDGFYVIGYGKQINVLGREGLPHCLQEKILMVFILLVEGEILTDLSD